MWMSYAPVSCTDDPVNGLNRQVTKLLMAGVPESISRLATGPARITAGYNRFLSYSNTCGEWHRAVGPPRSGDSAGGSRNSGSIGARDCALARTASMTPKLRFQRPMWRHQ
jgi:hypothetical protein